jgi:CRISPR-associated protein Cas1
MRRHDNTLYVTTQGAYLAKEGTNVLVRVEKETKLALPVHTLGSIVCFGNVLCSPFLLGMCGRENVAVTYLTENGRFLARVEGEQSGNVYLRRAQHRITAVPELAAPVAAAVVGAKIANSRTTLQRAIRDHGPGMDVAWVRWSVRRLRRLLALRDRRPDLVALRALEADAARAYFRAFNKLIVIDDPAFRFKGRTRRPPLDRVNAMLSFVYSLLARDVAAACESVGLDPQMGFLHADRPGRPSLALDIMEEFRAMLADRLVLSLINRRQVGARRFKVQESGAVEMDDTTRKTVLVEYQKRKQSELTHPYLGERVTIGLLPFVQARLLARFLRGDLAEYPAFFWK